LSSNFNNKLDILKVKIKNITKIITDKVDKIPAGYVFTYSEIIDDTDKAEAIIKSLNRMVVSGKLKKISKGRFYKPEKTPFGELEPSEYQVAKDLLEKDNKVIGYLTGLSIYNKLGLTTQISNTIQIGRNNIRPSLIRGKYKISFILQKNTINKKNIPFLQLIDAIKYFKKIPASDVDFIINRFKTLLLELSNKQLKMLIKLLMQYPANTRALTGALIDEIGKKNFTEEIKSSLNPITSYKLEIPKEILSTKINWNIK